MGTIVGRGRRASQDEEDKSKILSHLLLNFDFRCELIFSMCISFLRSNLTMESDPCITIMEEE